MIKHCMNGEEIRRAVTIMSAYLKGAEIEYSPRTGPNEGRWWGGIPQWNWADMDYRIRQGSTGSGGDTDG